MKEIAAPRESTPAQRLAARHPEPDDRLAMRQRWEALLFLHWEIEPERIQATLPEGLWVDTFEGRAYLGVVPFFMRQVRPAWGFRVPWISDFLELNVRTYVVDRDGVPGVWFFSLDADRAVAVEVARRWYSLPYEHAAMRATVGADRWVDYTCRRRGRDTAAAYRYPLLNAGDGSEAQEGSLDFFLLERYRLFSWNRRKRRLLRGQVEHRPYRYHLVEQPDGDATPAGWDGFEIGGPPVHAAVTASLDVSAYAVRM